MGDSKRRADEGTGDTPITKRKLRSSSENRISTRATASKPVGTIPKRPISTISVSQVRQSTVTDSLEFHSSSNESIVEATMLTQSNNDIASRQSEINDNAIQSNALSAAIENADVMQTTVSQPTGNIEMSAITATQQQIGNTTPTEASTLMESSTQQTESNTAHAMNTNDTVQAEVQTIASSATATLPPTENAMDTLLKPNASATTSTSGFSKKQIQVTVPRLNISNTQRNVELRPYTPLYGTDGQPLRQGNVTPSPQLLQQSTSSARHSASAANAPRFIPGIHTASTHYNTAVNEIIDASMHQRIPATVIGSQQQNMSSMSVLGLYRDRASQISQKPAAATATPQCHSPSSQMQALSINDPQDNATQADRAYEQFLAQCSPMLRGMDNIAVRVRDEAIVLESVKCQEEILGKYHERILQRARELERSDVLTPELESLLQEFTMEVDEKYANVKTDVLVKLNRLTASTRPTTATGSQSDPASNIALKRLSIERFDGNEQKWPNFKAKFEQFIHNNPSMDNLTKFMRLDDSIVFDSEPYKRISGIHRLPEYYEQAWELLVAKYDNPQRIVDANLDAFIDMPAINTATRVNINKLINGVNHLTASLRKYPELNVDSWDPIIVNILMRKLDKETISLWRHERPQKQIAKLQPLLDFLNRRADGGDLPNERRASAAPPANNQRAEVAAGPAPTQAHSQQQHHQAEPQVRSRIKVPVKCSMCQREHQLFGCNEFKSLTVDQRIRRARQFRVCEKCLKPNCHPNRCKLGPCKYCNGNHNGLLCTLYTVPSVNALEATQ